MKTALLFACVFPFIVGYKTGVPKSSTVEQRQNLSEPAVNSQSSLQASGAQNVEEWRPISKGPTYQLSLKNSVFGFCDNTGPQQIDLATGHQTASTSTCDRKADAIKNGCGDQVDIVSSSDGPYDTVSVDRYSFRLHGHVRDCDRDGDLVIVSTTGEIVLMNSSTNKIAFIKADLPDTVVLGSGWAAWNSQDTKAPINLIKTSTLLRQAVTPPEG